MDVRMPTRHPEFDLHGDHAIRAELIPSRVRGVQSAIDKMKIRNSLKNETGSDANESTGQSFT
jgi:hypothetical protein